MSVGGASATPNLHRGSTASGLSPEVINLEDPNCLLELAGIIESLGLSHELWLLPDEAVWVLSSTDTLLRVRGTAPPASTFALQQLACLRASLATVQHTSFDELEPDWQEIITSLRPRIAGLHEQAATLRMNTVGP